MWSFSTLQRPTQEEKERRRKYREEKIRQHASTLLPKGKVGILLKNELHKFYMKN